PRAIPVRAAVVLVFELGGELAEIEALEFAAFEVLGPKLATDTSTSSQSKTTAKWRRWSRSSSITAF
ncbi:MAG: hypothetical protein AAFU85_33760, partial [Planctomycetota bacterium]